MRQKRYRGTWLHNALLVLVAVGVSWSPLGAQQATPTAADPRAEDAGGATTGDDEKASRPEQGDTWEEFVKRWLTPRPYPKEQVIKIDEKYAYPHVAVGYSMEIVREDDDAIWLVGLPPENPRSPLHTMWLQRQVDELDAVYRQEYFSQPGSAYFLDHRAETPPPPFVDELRLEPVAPDLPKSGRWQMGFAVADMNGDGHLDLVFPPQRKGIPPQLTIFAGDGRGDFKLWRSIEIPNVGLDYGGVAVADFDADGHQDIAIAIHFGPQYILFGDEAASFRRLGRLPSPDARLTSRAVTAADFNGDGRTDLAFIAEVDFERSSSAAIEGARTVWVALNGGEQWSLDTNGLPENFIGDVIRSADVNQDGRPDLVLSSSTLNQRDLVYLNGGDGPWTRADERGVLSAAYHFNVEPGDGEVFATFVQFRMVEGENQALNGLMRYPLTFGDEPFVNGQPVHWERERSDVYFRIAVGDLNGDGRTDLAAARKGGGLELWLQTEDGQFYRDRAPELDAVGRVFDLRLVDLDGDGRDDIIASYVPNDSTPGGIGVWLSRGTAAQ